MKNFIAAVLSVLLLISLSSCKTVPAGTESTAGTPESNAYPVYTPPQKCEPPRIAQTRFVLAVTQNPKDYSAYVQYVYARYDDMFFISLYDGETKTEYVYLPRDGAYALYTRDDIMNPYVKAEGRSGDRGWAEAAFFSGIGEGSVSIGAVCGAWGEDTGEKITLDIELFYPGPKIPGGHIKQTKEYRVYSSGGLFPVIDPDTNTAVCLLREAPDPANPPDAGKDGILHVTAFYTEDDVGAEYFWWNVSFDRKMPEIG